MMTELTEQERESLSEHCVGYGEYGCTEDHTHKHLPGCFLFKRCEHKDGEHVRSALIEAVEKIVRERCAVAWDDGYGHGRSDGAENYGWGADVDALNPHRQIGQEG